MEAYIVDWLNLLVRWLHLVTGIAWIGASFYFVMLDNSLSPPEEAGGREARRVRRALGRPRRRLLQQPEVPHGSEGRAAVGESPLVEVGGLHDVAVGDGAPRDHLLVRGELLSDRSGRTRAVAAGRRGDQHRVHRRRLARLRRAVPRARRQRERPRRRDARAGDGRRLGAVPRLRRARGLRPRRRDDRHDDGRQRVLPHHPRAEADGRRHPRRPRARSDAGNHRQAALGAQHVLHAARAVRDDQQSLSDDVQPSVRLARARRDHAGGRADPAVLRAAAQGPHAVGASRGRGRAPRRTGGRPRTGAAPACGQGGRRRVRAR